MPSFAIEVPGEANPLTENLLIQTLHSASSSDPNQIQAGTKQLQQWEKSDGYYRHLQSAYLNHSLPLEVRYLAIIQVKNGIDKYWRKTATNAVSNEDKKVIRERFVPGILNETEDRLALSCAVVIAKIFRYTQVDDWPDGISAFLNVVRSPSSSHAQLMRALLALLYIVKELSTHRLQRKISSTQAATREITAVLGDGYSQTVQRWISSPKKEDMRRSLLAIRAIRRLLASTYENHNRDQDFASFWSLTLSHLDSFLQLIKAQGTSLPADVSNLLNKHALQLAKLHYAMAKDHSVAYALLPNSLNLTRSYWIFAKEFAEVRASNESVVAVLSSGKIESDRDTEEKPFMENMTLKALLIIRACVRMVNGLGARSFKYRTAEDKEEKKQAIDTVKQELFDLQFIQDAMGTLVTRFFVLRPSDLQEWIEEPDEWEKREEDAGEDWDLSVRPCSEKLFLDLALCYKDIVVQPLLSVFRTVATPENEDVLLKDSIYSAVGLSAAIIREKLDFDAFVRDVLIAEVQKSKPGFNILRRRTAIMLGQWVTVKISNETRPLVYQIFQHLLNHEDPLNDQVVRVTAGRQLQNIANDWDFQADQFLPYGQTILTQLMQLVQEIDSVDTKMALLNSLSTIVERLDHQILPFAERIVNLLPPLWEQSEDEHMMKQSILVILARLVNAMRADSLPLHSMAFAIIEGALQQESYTTVYLLDDALDLWTAVLAQTPSDSASPDLIRLVQYLPQILELGSDNLRKGLEIMESYILLTPSYVLSDNVRPVLFKSFSELMNDLKVEANGILCILIELIIRAAIKLGGEPAVTQTTKDLVDSGFLVKLISGLHDSWVAHCTTGPRAKKAPVDGIIETDHFSVLARTIIGSTNAFCQAVQSCLPNTNLETSMNSLLEEWFSHFENIGDPSRRKLMCLALTSLLDTNQPFIMVKLQSLMNVWTDVVTELKEGAEDLTGAGGIGDSLVYAAPDQPEEPESPEDVRRRSLTYSDEVHTINLPQFVRHHLQKAVAASGGEQQFQQQWLVNVDQDVIKAFSELGIM